MSDPDNLRLYASIFRKPRRYSAGAQLMPPSFIEMEAAQALEEKANSLATQKNPDLCTACEGSGREQFKRDGFIVQDTPCQRCGGSGRA